MIDAVDDTLELQAAADSLGVHYQTAYRWVRGGRLPARLVNGRYVVERRDLAELAAARSMPAAPSRPSSARVARQAERMHDALLAGDEAVAREIARRLVDDGTGVIELIDAVIVPPLRRIGQGWHDGELTIWVEHRATAIVERLLGDVLPNPRGRRRGTAMVAALAGDRHSLPTAMAAVALREAAWHVHHLGADMPADELVRFCAEHAVDLAVLSVTNPAATELAALTARRVRSGGTPTLVGAPGRTLEDLVIDAAAAIR